MGASRIFQLALCHSIKIYVGVVVEKSIRSPMLELVKLFAMQDHSACEE